MTPVVSALALAMALGQARPSPEIERTHEGPTDAAWTGPEPTAEVAPPSVPSSGERSTTKRSHSAEPPPPRVDPRAIPIEVAIALSPEAPGSRRELDLLDALERTAAGSTDPPTKVRRLRPGAPEARQICRQGRYDLVVTVGYVPDREAPVLLSHDCGLDMALGLRAIDAVEEPGLVPALWEEHEALVREGVQERRRVARLRPGVRAGIVAGVALVVLGVAVGVLVANALRDERVVLKVAP